VHDDDRRHVELLLHDERHDGLLLQSDDGHVQVRDDREGRLHHVHERRRQMLRDDSSVLHLLLAHDGRWLHVLSDDEQHAGLLLRMLSLSRS
jgi:hypothetical protein